MFTGLVEEMGTVRERTPSAAGARLAIACDAVRDGLAIGDSVSVNGACLTVVEMGDDWFAVDCVEETLRRTSVGDREAGDHVNLERAMRVGDRLGGHIVQGHVDGTGTVRERTPSAAGARLVIACDAVRDGPVWGTDVYTRDSALCAAAAHAGVVGREGGEITALEAPGRDIYIGTARNGITSNDYGMYRQSLRFDGAPPPADGPELCPQRLSINPELPTPYTCRCSAEAVGAGTVWGTDAYTGDSNLCSAAAHAGAVRRDGGVLTVYREAGRDLYVGSARNGVTSNDYGRYANSLRFLIRAF